MATKYLRGAGTGVWSTNASWSTTSSAGAANTTKPVAGDAVILNAGSPSQCTVDTSTQRCATLNCTGYTGNLVLEASIITSGNVTLVTGMTFTANAKGWNALGGTFIPAGKTFYSFVAGDGSGGTVTLSGSDMIVRGILSVSGASAVLTGRTITFVGINAGIPGAILSQSGGTLSSNLIINCGANEVYIGSSPSTASLYYSTGTLTYVDGIVNTSYTTCTLFINGSATINTAGINWKNVRVTAAASITLSSALNMTGTLELYGAATFIGAFNITCAEFSCNKAAAHTLSGDIDCNGLFWVDVGNVVLDGVGKKIYISGGVNLAGFSCSGTASMVLDGAGTWAGSSMNSTISNNLTIAAGSNTITIASAYYGSGSLTYVSGTVGTGTGTMSFMSSVTIPTNLTWNCSILAYNGTYTITGDLNVVGNLAVYYTVIFSGEFTINCGGLLSLAINNKTFSGPVNVNGNVSIESGSALLQGTYQWNVSGNWANNAGVGGRTGNNKVVFDGTSTISGTTSFYDLEVLAGRTVHLTSGTTQTVTNLFIADGTSSSKVTIDSTTPGSTASLSKASGVVVCDYLTISDNVATGGAAWHAGNHSTESNVTGWLFDDWGMVEVNSSAEAMSGSINNFGRYALITLTASDPTAEIRYTIDGPDPTYASIPYTGPFMITGTTVKYRAYLGAGTYEGQVFETEFIAEPAFPPSGFMYNEYYLYADKVWEVIPSGVSFFTLDQPNIQNSPVVVTSSGYEVGLDDPWAKTEGAGKWTKVGFGSFTMNANGTFDSTKKEFSLQPDASGKLLFNQMLTENLLVEYEGGDSGYYTMTALDYNPMRNEVGGGFVHFSRLSDPRTLFLTASQGSILADGFQGCVLTATLFDKNFDRVPEKNITFEMMNLTNGDWAELGHLIPNDGTVLSLDSSGVAYRTQESTNGRGEARAKWITHKGKPGTQYIKAYYSDASGIYDLTSFAQFYWSTGPFILDVSLLDSLDYLVGDRYIYTPDSDSNPNC